MTMEHQSDMEFAHSTSLTSSRSSTPTLTYCERLQMVQAELRKYSVMHSGVRDTPLTPLLPTLLMITRNWPTCIPNTPTLMKDNNK
ncbi:hypothetical protein TNCV_1026961 [Trichonephila clavipes]|nr:hypothetical protein TNCV_1026961 [Trichonephila clavipes]